MADEVSAREATIARAVDSLPSLVGYWNAEQINVFANQVYAKFFGLLPAQIRGMHIRDVLGSSLYEANRLHIEGAVNGLQQHFERIIVDVDGVSRTTQVTYVPDVVDGRAVGFTVLVVDVSDRAEAERQRQGDQRLLEEAMENAHVGKAVVTADGSWLYVNRAFCDLLGYTREEVRSLSFHDVVHPEETADSDEHLAALVSGRVSSVACERRYVRKDGATIWVQRNATMVRGTHSGDVIIAEIQDVTARRVSAANLAREAMSDHLTGLGNRRHLMEAIASVSPDSRDWPVGIIFVDVDDFKSINDAHGHDVGDLVLVEVSRRLCENIRGIDLACRFGGDEFVVVLRQVRSADHIRQFAQRIETSLRGDYRIGDLSVALSASVGWSFDPDRSAHDLLRSADARMYDAKASDR
ncbi:MAG: diguanylate cyclase [Rhodococcus sp. (in: high G+C Gram-positive bacteria)]